MRMLYAGKFDFILVGVLVELHKCNFSHGKSLCPGTSCLETLYTIKIFNTLTDPGVLSVF
jgi:hypothetical protein